MKQKIEEVQQNLREQKLDGWLLYDFRRSNDLACQFLEIPSTQLLTRRFFYWIPSQGEPIKIVHAIENPLKDLPGKILKFTTWQQLEMHLKEALKNSHRVAMEYSPCNAIPYVSKVDAGTLDVIRGLGKDVVSSCNILQNFSSVLTIQQAETHFKATHILDQIAQDTWNMLTTVLKAGKEITEYDVQEFILKKFDFHDCVTEGVPICAVNAHSADPHYSPSRHSSSIIRIDDFILIDLWCKHNSSGAIYGDITRVAVAAKQPSQRHQEIFKIVRKAQEAATELVQHSFVSQKPLHGWEVDKAARDVITEAGYGDYFIHRTGHSIDISDHGSGANIDNFETRDQRLILPGTCFSIEPGIYLPNEWGIRLEYDIYVSLDGIVTITGGIQDSIKTLL